MTTKPIALTVLLVLVVGAAGCRKKPAPQAAQKDTLAEVRDELAQEVQKHRAGVGDCKKAIVDAFFKAAPHAKVADFPKKKDPASTAPLKNAAVFWMEDWDKKSVEQQLTGSTRDDWMFDSPYLD